MKKELESAEPDAPVQGVVDPERRPKRRRTGLRIPSDNVPRRPTNPHLDSAAATAAPDDPHVAVSVAYAFGAGGPAAPEAEGDATALEERRTEPMPAVTLDALSSAESSSGDSIEIAFEEEEAAREQLDRAQPVDAIPEVIEEGADLVEVGDDEVEEAVAAARRARTSTPAQGARGTSEGELSEEDLVEEVEGEAETVAATAVQTAAVVEPEAAPDHARVGAPAEPARDRAATEIEPFEELSATELEEVTSGPVELSPGAPPALPIVAPAPPPAASPRVAAAIPAVAPPALVTASGPATAPTPAVAAPETARVDPSAPVRRPPPAPQAPQPAGSGAARAAAVAAVVAPRSRRRRGRPWFEEVFDEDYLRTLPFLTPQATQAEAAFVGDSLQLAPGSQILDVGCGYGRHAMELAARGYHVVGLDASLPLLIRGADEAQRRGLTINFVHGDMREITFDAQFDGAYCLFSTFGYFDDETNKRTAQNIARALKPGARFLLEVLNRDYLVVDLPARVWWEGDGCVVLEEVEFNYFSSRMVSNRSVVFDDGRQLEQEISIRGYGLHELGKLLHAAGFRILEVSGSMATRGRFFGAHSREIVVLCERRASRETSGVFAGTQR